MSKPIPVAWITKGGTGDLWWHKGSESDMPLYLEPQKEWVGLTDDELKPICGEYRILFGGWVNDFAKAIEAKLKEKNI